MGSSISSHYLQLTHVPRRLITLPGLQHTAGKKNKTAQKAKTTGEKAIVPDQWQNQP